MSERAPYRIAGRTGEWEVVLGLEVHAQVASEAKLFSGAPTGFGAEPNEHVSLVDAAFPGMLPVINRRCVEQAIRTGLGLRAQINLTSRFDRKNYFYPDLPKGYQISQYDEPLCLGGRLGDVRIHRVHLEEDAAKLTHVGSSGRIHGSDASIVDFNRGGTPLAEIVTEPDLT